MTWRRKSDIDEDLHESIMAATARAIETHGVADLTVRDIGAEFDRSRSLIHYHYNSKEDLLAAFVEYIVDRYAGSMTYDSGGDPERQLDAFVRQSLFGPASDAEEHWRRFAAQYALRPVAMHDERLRNVLAENYERTHETLADIVAAGVRRGVFRDVDPDLTAQLILAVVDSARGQRLILGDDEAPETLYLALGELVYPAVGAEQSTRTSAES